MKKSISFLGIIFLLISCQEDDLQLGDPPSQEDVKFSYQASSTSDNIIIFTAPNPNVIANWDFGNDTKSEGITVTGIYPTAGVYTVTLTVYTSGGSLSNTENITIAKDDATLLDNPIFNALTGGASIGSRTWVIDSISDAHMGVGPNPSSAASGDTPEWWAAAACDKKGAGLYDDYYTFHLNAFKMDMEVHKYVYVHTDVQSRFTGAFQVAGDFKAPYDDQMNVSWNITEEEGENFINFSQSEAFIGMYTGVNKYKILSISDDLIQLRYLDDVDPGRAWYVSLIPLDKISGDCEGAGSGGGGGGSSDDGNRTSLPIDFEGPDTVKFDAFGGSSDTIIANPYPGGIDTSSMVLSTDHGNETWAGVFVDLDSTLDFSSKTEIAVKIFAPNSGTLRIKLEDSNNSNTFVEKDVTVTSAITWEKVSIDFSGEPAGTYDRIVLFPGWGIANAGTFYLDDIEQQ